MSAGRPLSICVIVLDSAGASTFRRSCLSFLPTLAPTVLAESTASFTLPSHISTFTGILPRPLDPSQPLLAGYDLIFRSASARPTAAKCLFHFEGATLMDHCLAQGYDVVGFGGTSFFDTRSPGNLMPGLFPKFIDLHAYFEIGRQRVFRRDERVFALNNIDLIASQVSDGRPFFLFVNEIATHIPYDHPCGEAVDQEALRECYGLHDSKRRLDEGASSPAVEPIAKLAYAQARSLEWCDRMLQRLFASLPNVPTLALILGDHGEEFGESGRFGHGHLSREVMQVPVWAAILNG